MRIIVYDVLSNLASGDSIKEKLEHFPMLTDSDILTCLADAEREFTKLAS